MVSKVIRVTDCLGKSKSITRAQFDALRKLPTDWTPIWESKASDDYRDIDRSGVKIGPQVLKSLSKHRWAEFEYRDERLHARKTERGESVTFAPGPTPKHCDDGWDHMDVGWFVHDDYGAVVFEEKGVLVDRTGWYFWRKGKESKPVGPFKTASIAKRKGEENGNSKAETCAREATAP